MTLHCLLDLLKTEVENMKRENIQLNLDAIDDRRTSSQLLEENKQLKEDMAFIRDMFLEVTLNIGGKNHTNCP